MLKYDWWEFILFVMISVWFDLLRWINVLKVETCGLLASYIWDWGFVQVLYLVVKDINCEVVLVIALSFLTALIHHPLGVSCIESIRVIFSGTSILVFQICPSSFYHDAIWVLLVWFCYDRDCPKYMIYPMYIHHILI